MALFGLRRAARPRPAADGADRRRIAEWVREAGGLDNDCVIKVNEIVCPDPACPGMETVILVMAPSAATIAHKITRPAGEVVREDVVRALGAAG